MNCHSTIIAFSLLIQQYEDTYSTPKGLRISRRTRPHPPSYATHRRGRESAAREGSRRSCTIEIVKVTVEMLR
jgi:hypothetical protein